MRDLTSEGKRGAFALGLAIAVTGPKRPISEQVGLVVGAAVIAEGLLRVYEAKDWRVPTPVWIGVTGGLTWLGWQGYKRLKAPAP